MITTNQAQQRAKTPQPGTHVLVSAGANSVLPYERTYDNSKSSRRVIVARPKTAEEVRVGLLRRFGAAPARKNHRTPIITTQIMEERKRNRERARAAAEKKAAGRGRKKK